MQNAFFRELRRQVRYNGVLYLMCLPVVLGVFIFNYVPKVGLVMAFQKLDLAQGIFTSPWVGFENFRYLFSSTYTWRITRNTILYSLWFMVSGTALSVLLALLINEVTNKRLAKWLQTIYMMPNFLSIVAVAMATYAFLSDKGYLNKVIAEFGGRPLKWYSETYKWPAILTVVNIWKGVGFSSVIYLATISGINEEYYEAAVIDGATRFQQARFITLPFLKPMITILLIFSVGGMMSGDFGLFYVVTMNTAMLYETTDIIDTYIFRSLLTATNYGTLTAAGIYQSGVGFLLLLLTNWIVRKLEPDNAVF